MKHESPIRRHFASDNYAGICPEALATLIEANAGHSRSYGDDPWTGEAHRLISEVFETDCETFFVYTGTAANSLALASLCQSYHSILCHESAHVEVAECGGPEFFSNGSKLILLRGANGKIDPAAIEKAVHRRDDVHYPKPRALSLTQATEMGTLYTVEELRAITAEAAKYNLRVHMDGARFANAVAASGLKPRELTWESGVDVLSFGLTKNGVAAGEVVVFFKKELAEEFEYRRKQAGQLASKMRFLSASWVGMLREGAWLRHAQQANAMATRLAGAIEKLPGVAISFPVETNAVFARMPSAVVDALHQRGWRFYTHVPPGTCRLMCSWDTTEGDVDGFAQDVKSLTQSA